jgi:hypothetical protein
MPNADATKDLIFTLSLQSVTAKTAVPEGIMSETKVSVKVSASTCQY